MFYLIAFAGVKSDPFSQISNGFCTIDKTLTWKKIISYYYCTNEPNTAFISPQVLILSAPVRSYHTIHLENCFLVIMRKKVYKEENSGVSIQNWESGYMKSSTDQRRVMI